jgi:hypothetical protein
LPTIQVVSFPLESNAQFMTVKATQMPYTAAADPPPRPLAIAIENWTGTARREVDISSALFC